MPLHYPSKTVKLPFNAPHLSSSSSTDEAGFLKTKRTYTTSQIEQTICGMSMREAAKQKHQQCSEPFYATAIREAIKSDSASSSEEKRKMMEMLARFERGETEGGNGSDVNGLEELLKGMGGLEGGKGQAGGEEGAEEEGFEELEALIQRLGDGSDIDNMDLQEILDLLPPSHRDQFMSLVSDPNSEQVQRLLGSLEEAERKDLEGGSLPWFMLKDSNDQDEEDGDSPEAESSPTVRNTVRPRPVSDEVTHGINVDPAVGVKLLYNTLAICLTYVQVLISHSLPSLGHVWTRQSGFSDDDRPEILSDDILRMVPFLGDVKSTLRFASIREVWEDVWTHMGEANSLNTRQATDSRGSSGAKDQLMTVLAQVQRMLVPSLDLAEEREQGVELALSDLHDFFAKSLARLFEETTGSDNDHGTTKPHIPNGTTRRQQKALLASEKKVAFYVAAVQAVRRQYGRQVWLELSAEVGREIESLRAEMQNKQEDTIPGGSAEDSVVRRIEGLTDSNSTSSSLANTNNAPTVARIEEL
ncbi:hypothetical protein QFC20_001621 [Naganishia adeliensis]|uniref:Uncharacterized protein n=1 Tax=Naganishia adeliensis TaxID=92952 RepID=A0ACC2WSE7_9TREE|nr:hypothetical protein QFC20_001621 [Naganishia adeliensis]